jgi:predicted CopG family antitoxin
VKHLFVNLKKYNYIIIKKSGSEKKSAKSIHIYNAHNPGMSAVKRIPVTEPVWKDLAEMRSAGQTYSDLLAEMIEDRKKRRLEEDVRTWTRRKKKDFVSLSEIKD